MRGLISCYDDGPCYNFTASHLRTLTAGVRWYTRPGFYLQGLGGATYSSHEYRDFRPRSWWAPADSLAVGWRRPVPGQLVGVELRAAYHGGDRDDYTVVSATAILSVGRAW